MPYYAVECGDIFKCVEATNMVHACMVAMKETVEDRARIAAENGVEPKAVTLGDEFRIATLGVPGSRSGHTSRIIDWMEGKEIRGKAR